MMRIKDSIDSNSEEKGRWKNPQYVLKEYFNEDLDFTLEMFLEDLKSGAVDEDYIQHATLSFYDNAWHLVFTEYIDQDEDKTAQYFFCYEIPEID